MRKRQHKIWIPILLGVFLSTGNAASQSAADSIAVADSVLQAQPLTADSLAVADPIKAAMDSVMAVQDSVPPKRKKEALDEPTLLDFSET